MKLTIVCNVALSLFLVCCLGEGRAVEGWGLAYAAMLSYLSIMGLYWHYMHEEKRCNE